MKINQISVFLENRAGQLAEITKLLADNGVNLRAVSIAETADYGILRIIADDPDKASKILLDNGNIIALTPVIIVGVPDEPSGLAKLLEILAKSELSIEYMYSLLNGKGGKAYMVFRISDEDKFLFELAANGIPSVSAEELGMKLN